MRIIYDTNGKPTTATDENADQMIEYCGYSSEWPPESASKNIPAEVGHRPDDAEPGSQIDGQGLAPIPEGKASD